MVKPVLDCGALGAVFPQIATREEAEAAVRAVRYAPDGERGYGPTYAALRWGLSNLDYLEAANDAVLPAVLDRVASRRGRARRHPEGRAVSTSSRSRGAISPENLGVAGQFDHPRLREVVAEAERKILARPDVVLGGIAFSAEDARSMIARGYRFVVLGLHAGLVSGAAQRMLQAIKETP